MRTSLIGSGALGGLLMLAGCIVPVPKGDNPLAMRLMTRDRLENYSEAVFRRQNRVMSRLMMAAPKEMESLSTRDRLRLKRLEKRMNDACAPLNNIASARARGGDTSFEQENDVRQTVRVCAAETARLEQFLDEMKFSG